MLSIYPVSLAVCSACVPVIDRLRRRDADLARQLQRAVTSVPLNIAEGDGQSGGHRKQRHMTALGSAREVAACLDVARAMGHVERDDLELRAKLGRVIGVLVRVTR